MFIHLDDVKKAGLSLECDEDATDFPLLADLAAKGDVRFSSPVHTSLRVYMVSGMVEVEGNVTTNVMIGCGRCLNDFELSMDLPFALTFARELPEVSGDEGEEIEVSAEEMGILLFEGDDLDLREAVAEQVIMALPLQPLCSHDCKGLCPECGGDLNLEKCNCIAPPINNKFAVLKDFKAAKK